MNSRLFKAVAVLLSGSAASQLLIFLATPLLVNYYSAEQFGVFGVFMSLAGIASTVFCLRFEMALYAVHSLRKAAYVVSSGLIWGAFFAVVSYCIIFLAEGLGLQGLWSELGNTVYLLPLAALSISYFLLFSNYLSLLQKFNRASSAKLVRAIAMLSGQFSLSSFSGNGLVWGELIGRLVAILLMVKSVTGRIGRLTLAKFFAVNRINHRFIKISTPAALINVSVTQSPVIFIIWLFGAEAAGIYVIAQRLVASPTAMFSLAMNQVVSSEIARLWNKEPAKCRRLFLIGLRNLVLVGVPAFGLAIWVAPWLINQLFDSSWQEAGLLVQILGIMYLGQFITAPFFNLLNILQRQDIRLKWDSLRLLLVTTIFLLAEFYQLSIEVTLAYYCFGMGISYLVLLLIIHLQLNFSVESTEKKAI